MCCVKGNDESSWVQFKYVSNTLISVLFFSPITSLHWSLCVHVPKRRCFQFFQYGNAMVYLWKLAICLYWSDENILRPLSHSFCIVFKYRSKQSPDDVSSNWVIYNRVRLKELFVGIRHGDLQCKRFVSVFLCHGRQFSNIYCIFILTMPPK